MPPTVRNPDAVAIARKHATERVQDISRRTRAGIKRAIISSLEKGEGPDKLARKIRSQIGLNERQSQAVATLRKRLKAQGMSNAAIKKQVDRYSAKLLKQRSVSIARTELSDALSRGWRANIVRQSKAGLIAKGARRQWITARVGACARCIALNGQMAQIGGTYPGGVEAPPRHPMCRCGEILVTKQRRR